MKENRGWVPLEGDDDNDDYNGSDTWCNSLELQICFIPYKTDDNYDIEELRRFYWKFSI